MEEVRSAAIVSYDIVKEYITLNKEWILVLKAFLAVFTFLSTVFGKTLNYSTGGSPTVDLIGSSW